ncbi:transcription cofactor vestigial-like protein 2 [Mizuhopecten yessoensis]|uniref:Transcription cofactor vestigial-like protein 2 n=1 Tax=Mizuhopecten yessoensis TaxID=6573 RepID=A0A210PXX0_MIZYE|nr:transcription cofactor vestigial-like protein 2 [Mizuhopecten yessoensis]OWF41340.1 Transcription cofactor vestigial-like protein 2 [Mizuhopecten yessoensis]
MSCTDLMYQFYPPYFSHKTTPSENGKLTNPVPYESQHVTAPGSYCCPGDVRHTKIRDTDPTSDIPDPESQPKGSQYFNANCVLLTYFNGDTATNVDEHFSRALSQPSSFTLEKNGSQNLRRSDTPLMCQRKLPPSFWNSAYQPPRPSFASGSSADYPRDYLTSPWYTLSNNWPYHFAASQSYSNAPDFARSFPYSSFDSASKLGPSYQSLMLRSGFDSRNSKYEMSKLSDSLQGAGSYYASLQRFGADLSSNVNYDSSTTSSLDYPLQSMRKDICW